MSSDRYNKPDEGTEDWHIPLNENFNDIGVDVEDLYEQVDTDGEELFPQAVYQHETEAPIQGPIVEAFESGDLDHYENDTGDFDIVPSDLEGEHMLEGVAEGDTTVGIQSDAIETQRGFSYAAYVRVEDTDDVRAQAGPVVLADWDEEENLAEGYQVRLNIEDDELEVLKWQDGEFQTGSRADTDISLAQGYWYRVEIDLDWDRVHARVYDPTEQQVGEHEYVDSEEDGGDPIEDHGGFGWRVRSDDGTTVTADFDLLTKQPLGATPGRVSGPGDGSNGDVDIGGYAEWDVLVTGNESDGYEAIDSEGEEITSTISGPVALQDSIDECPEGGTLVVKGYYVFDEGEDIDLEKDLRVLGYGATLESQHEDVGTAIWHVDGEGTGSYEVIGIDHRNSGSPILQFNQNVDDIMSESDLLFLETDQRRDIYGTEETYDMGCGHKIAMTATEEDEAHEDTDFLDDLSDDEVTLADHLQFDYDLSYDLEAEHYEPVQVEIKGFDIIGPDIWYPEISGIELEGTTDSVYEDLYFYNISHKCLQMDGCYDDTVRNSDFSHGASNHDGGDGYGVAVRNGTAHTLIENCDFTAMRHGVDHSSSSPGNVRRHTTVRDCTFRYHRSTALDMHGADIHHKVINCTFDTGRDDGADHCEGAMFRGCVFKCFGNAGIHASGTGTAEMYDVDVVNCTFIDCNRGVRFSATPSAYRSVNITGSRFVDCSDAIQIRQRVRDLNVSGTTFIDNSNAIEIAARGFWSDLDLDESQHGVNSGSISGCTFEGDSDCIRIYDDGYDPGDYAVAKDLSITGCNAVDVGEFIRGDVTAERLMINGNRIADADAFIDDESGRFGDWFVTSNYGTDVTEMFDGQWDDEDHEEVTINSG